MQCPACNSPDSRVINSRETDKQTSTWRRRQCWYCAYVFTTEEIASANHLFVIKRSGKRQKFIYEKLFVSIFSAVDGQKNNDHGDNALLAKTITDQIIHSLIADFRIKKEVPTSKLIVEAYEVLRDTDIAYSDRYLYYSNYRRTIVETLHYPPSLISRDINAANPATSGESPFRSSKPQTRRSRVRVRTANERDV